MVSSKSDSGADQIARSLGEYFRLKNHSVIFFKPKKNNKLIKKSRFLLLAVYILRTIKTCFYPFKPKSVFYASSDFFFDVLPGIWAKIKRPESKFFFGLNLVAPNPFLSYKNKLSLPSFSLLFFYLSQRLMLKLLKKFADFVFVVNQKDKIFLQKKGFLLKQIIIIRPGVDKNLIPRKVKKKYEAVWIGRLHPQKGFDDLIKAWQVIQKKLPKAKLLIIGEDKIKKYYFQKYTGSLNIFFSGFLKNKSKFRALKSAKLFLMPSFYESYGLVIGEAMACGLPVVAYFLESYNQLWPKGIIKVKPGEYRLLAQKTLDLLNNKKKFTKIAKEAKEFSQNLCWRETAKQILNKLNEKS